MRLDKWLKVSRVIKRRPIANDICDQGRVSINGRPAKASTEVKPGDKLEVRFGQRLVSLAINTIPAGQVSTKMAPELYTMLGETSLKEFETAVGDTEEEDTTAI